MSSKLVLCGLGNPGERYQTTRHNFGFWLVDFLSERFNGRWSFPCDHYFLSNVRIHGNEVLLVKPQTYMNLSGDALALLGEREPIVPRRLLVVCDDTALPLGQIRLRRSGSDGGHNGLKSIIERLNTARFPRLRLGVGPVPDGVDSADFVLSPFTEEENKAAGAMIRGAAKCAETWVENGIETAMNRFNVKICPKSQDPSDPPPSGEDPA